MDIHNGIARVRGAARRAIGSRVVGTATALYASTVTSYILPLVTLPYLARVLTPDVWGIIVFVQSVNMYVGMLVNYSFDLSATRDVAVHRDHPEKLGEIVSGVLGARLALAGGCVLVLGASQLAFSTLYDLGWLLWLGLFTSVAYGFGPFWYFLGVERVRWFTTLGVGGKICSLLLILWLVNQPADAWRVFAIYGATTVVVTLVAMAMIYRHVPFQLPSVSYAIKTLREGWNLFVFHVSTSIYGTSNTIILGFLAPAGAVAFYAGAERIHNAITMMLQPVIQAMYPRAARMARSDRSAAAGSVRVTIAASFVLACGASLILYFLTPFGIRIALGPGYEGAVPVFRILLLMLPIVAVTTPLLAHWIIPMGMERLASRVTIAGGVLHVPLAIALGSQFAHIGVAWTLVVTQVLLLTTLMGILAVRGLAPFGVNVRSLKADDGSVRIGELR